MSTKVDPLRVPNGRVGRLMAPGSPPAAAVLGYALLIPLVVGVALVAINGVAGITQAQAVDGLIGYSALLLGFLAGTRFGQAMRITGVSGAVLLTLVPVGLALIAVVAPDGPGIGLIAASLAAQGTFDVWAADRARLPGWYGRLRLRTTTVAVVLLVAAFVVVTGASVEGV